MGSGVSKSWHDQQILASAIEGNVERCKYLINQGADVNAVNVGNRWTPLHFAARAGKVELVEVLISLGADKSLKTAKGKTASQLAEDNGMDEVLGLFFVNLNDMSVQDREESGASASGSIQQWTNDVSIQGALAASEESNRYNESLVAEQVHNESLLSNPP